jgi:uncharacterized membrane protein
MKVLIESLCVGLSALLMGLLLHVILGHHALHASSPKMKEEMIRLSILLFLTGFSIHLVFEYIGLNKLYCKYGNASK